MYFEFIFHLTKARLKLIQVTFVHVSADSLLFSSSGRVEISAIAYNTARAAEGTIFNDSTIIYYDPQATLVDKRTVLSDKQALIQRTLTTLKAERDKARTLVIYPL